MSYLDLINASAPAGSSYQATGGGYTLVKDGAIAPASPVAPAAYAPSQATYDVNGNQNSANGVASAPASTPAYSAPAATEPNKSSTVISSQGAFDTIKNDTAKLNDFTQRGITVGADGVARYSDNSLVQAPLGSTQNTDGTYSSEGVTYNSAPNQYYDDPASEKLAQGLMANLDAQTKAQVDIIHSQYADLKAKQDKINSASAAGREQSLIMGGSQRYAQQSSQGIMQEQLSYGLDQIKALDDEERAAVSKAQQAQNDGQYKIMSEALNAAQDIRKEKQAAAQKLIESQAADLKKQREDEQQATRDNAIGDILSTGVTDPLEIQKALAAKGYKDITADNIAKTIESFTGEQKNVYDIMKTAASNGATPEIISAIGKAKNVQEAFSAAGDYLNTASGIIGEYNYYKREAQANGQTPVDFQTYQNQDANRKAKVASAANAALGDGNLNSKEATIFNGIVSKFNASPLTAAKDRTAVLQGTIYNVLKNPADAAQQLALAYGYIQALDTYQSSVREGELNLVNSIDSKVGQYQKDIDSIQKGQIVRPEVAKQIASAAQTLINTITDGANRKQKAYQAQANANGKNVGGAFSDFLGAVNETPGTHQSVAQDETAAGEKIKSIYPQHADQIKNLISTNPGISNADILQILGY